ncbi:uncharacterized protein [Miscanthus floridulus]|uniref:uncharacterized protein n=1 Tax=Miscanthus floridulus TaxID=154761 RepID=UPI00345B141D
MADMMKMLRALTTNMSQMQSDMAGMQEKLSSTSDSSTHHDGQHHTDRPPRFQKMDFPRFDGKSDPLIFINRCESYFRQQRTMPEEKVWMASYNLEDVAQLWFIQLQEDEGTPPWGRFKELLNLRFGPVLRSAPLFELSECRRTGSVEEYSNRFQALLPRAGRLEEGQRVQLYTGGLLPPLSHQVRIHAPETLAAAMSLARALELVELDRLNSTHAKTVPRAPGPPPAPRPGVLAALPAPVTPDPGAPDAASFPGATPGPTGATTKGWGVCRRIFYIDGVVLDEEVPEEEAPVYSLHAVAGVPVCGTLQLEVQVGAATLLALIDTGSTHCFIGEAAAQRAGLPVEPQPRLTATVANGERISCPGVLRHAPVVIDNRPFAVDLYIMPLAGYDLVLGTQWLATLGDIVWNMAAGTMAFKMADQQVCWRSVAPPTPPRLHSTSVAEPLLEELLAAFADVFAEPRGLPPVRGRAHRILLKPGTEPVAVRPYMYPAAHKTELEQQCATMIANGIVRRSDSTRSR